MALTLKLRSGEIEPPPELVFDAPRVVVGRASSCDLQLPDPSVSPRHASLRQRGSDWLLVDEGSDNGTFTARSRLARQAPHPLKDGELVRFGRVWVEVRIQAGGVPCEPGASRELSRTLVEQALRQEGLPAGMSVQLEPPAEPGADAESLKGACLRITQSRKPYVVGSQKSAQLRIDDVELPGRALELRRQAGELWVVSHAEDLPVLLSGRALARGERTLWPRGSTVLIGPRRLTYSDPTGEVLERIERGPTERLDPNELIEPPVGEAGGEEQDAGDADLETDAPELEAQDEVSANGSARVARTELSGSLASRVRRPAAGGAPEPTWSRGDAFVLLLALSVLGLSLWAIQWIGALGGA